MSSETIVTPGRRLGLVEEHDAGPGTYVRGGMIYSSILGTKRITAPETSEKPVIQVDRKSPLAIPTIGSEVLCRVIRMNPRAATVAIMMVGSTPCQEDFAGTIRHQDIRSTEKDLVQMVNSFRPGDVVRAEVISLGDQRSYFLATTKNEHGVVFAQSTAGNTMIPVSWEEMQDPKTKAVEKPKQGRIPQHVAFIMDGNRRYARKRHRIASSGHVSGFYRLANVLEWCNDLGIQNVSVFAFAINNFSRSPEEVSALMSLAKEKLRELADKSSLVKQHGVRIIIAGNRDLLPGDVREAAEFAEEKTQHNRGMRLNICFPYSATDEISAAIRKVTEDVRKGVLSENDIDEQAIESRLQIPGPPLDILVRTSGQIRFSNYMLWQSAKLAYIRFVDVFWPDFSFFHMFCILISWQLAYKSIKQRS
ncbi:cis-prenyltransferase [Coemansia sp. RSA 1821]|nr:cis-prenyltransferase [Coemansia sp. RSA 1821]